MSNHSVFRNPNQELELLTKQIAEMKSVLREMSTKLGQVERHALRAFGAGPSRRQPRTSNGKSSRESSGETPSLSGEDALKLFEILVTQWREQGGESVEAALENLIVADVRLLAGELGIPAHNKLSRRNLTLKVLGRVNESVMLTQNKNVTLPRTAETPATYGPNDSHVAHRRR